MGTDRCPVWRPDDCDGTDRCPPRCPRYVAEDGTAYTIYPLEECPETTEELGDWIERDDDPTEDERAPIERSTERAPIERSSVRTETESIELADRESSLVAVASGAIVAAAAPGTPDDPGAVVPIEDPTPELGAELVRQVIARRVDANGASRIDANGSIDREGDDSPEHRVGEATPPLSIVGPADALSIVADELGAACTLESADRSRKGERTLTVDLAADAATRTRRGSASAADVREPPDLSGLVEPDAVAVVGATDREGSIGRIVTENLFESFAGEVVPVTDRREDVLGVRAVPDVGAVADVVELAVIVLPAEPALAAVRETAEAGIENVAVLSAGFGETDADGAERERALREVVDRHDLTLLGPNALGVLSTRSGLNASFAPSLPEAGTVSVLSHSGAMITAILDWAEARAVGVRDLVSVGNGAGIDEAELLRHWGADPGTDVVLAYLEDVSDGRAFVEAAREVTPSTPVVALKSGRSEAGARAAASHTGALVGDDAGFDAAFDAGGVIRARSQTELFDLALALDRGPLPRGNRVAVVTNAGGPGVLAADAVAESDCALADLSAETIDGLRDRLPSAASASNPLDVLGDAGVDRFADALEAVLADPGVDAAIVTSTPHPLVDPEELATAVGDVARRYGAPVLASFSGGPPDATRREIFADAGVANYADAERAARSLAKTAEYARSRERATGRPTPVCANRGRVDWAIRSATMAERSTLGVDATAVLDAYGIPTPDDALVASSADAADAAARLGDRVALKVASPDVAHKSDVGGVLVDVPAAEAAEAYDELVDRVRSAVPEASIRGVLVQEMAPDGVECLAGVTRHPRFGPLVTFGLGGVFVEDLGDVGHALAPLARAEARDLVRSIESESILDGARGDEAVDVDALADALVRLSWLATEFPAIAEAEINPLVATPDGVLALDFHATLRE